MLALAGFLGIVAILLIGCASKPAVVPVVQKVDEAEILKARVNEYWAYVVAGKVDKAYLLELPAFREQVPLLQYVKRYNLVMPVEAEVAKVEVDGQKGSASVQIAYHVLLKNVRQKKLQKVEEQNWIKTGNEWFHVPGDFQS